MLESHVTKDIDQISKEILKQCKAYDVFPTPVDRILNYTELKIDKNINLSTISNDFILNISDTFKSAIEKIRGILDREKKIIYLDLNQNANRQNFIKLHEVGHDVLTWQTKTLKYLDNDKTLIAEAEEEFEAEASYFASATLFQQDRFTTKIKDLPLSLDSPMHLAKVFGASNHATIRRYVEHSKNRCALLVLQNLSPKGLSIICGIRNYFQSTTFTKSFGNIIWEDNLGHKWPFVRDYYNNRKINKDGYFSLDTDNGKVNFQYHFFNSTYNAFVLIFPVGESNKSKVEFIISR